jgi:hypothetical protein
MDEQQATVHITKKVSKNKSAHHHKERCIFIGLGGVSHYMGNFSVSKKQKQKLPPPAPTVKRSSGFMASAPRMKSFPSRLMCCGITTM